MHTHLRLPALLLLTSASLNAQVTAALKRSPNHSPEVEIRNTSAVNLTAFALRIEPAADAGPDVTAHLVFIDSLVETDPTALYKGSPLAPSAFVEQRVAELKRRHTALLESQSVLAIK